MSFYRVMGGTSFFNEGGGREFFSTRDSQALSFAVAIDFAFPFSPLPMVDQRISRKSPFDDSDPRCLSD